MSQKNKKRLWRIVATIIGLVALIALDSLLPNPWKFIGYLLIYFVISLDIMKEALENIMHGEIFDENFLMLIATIGAFILREYSEGIMVMLLFQIGELFQSIAVERSKHSVEHLLELKPEFATVKRDNQWVTVKPEEVQIGEVILVKPGERIPLDGLLLSDEATVNLSALTGESVPVDQDKGSDLASGGIVLNHSIELKVTALEKDSTTAKMIRLVEEASEKKSHSEQFIRKFARYYTPVVVIIAALLAVVPLFFFGFSTWQTWLYRALIFLVISCPCALVVSVPLSFFAGIGAASKNGILVKGSQYFETMAKLQTIVFDKTGTLTTGQFKVAKVHSEKMPEQQLLELAAYAEEHSTHPIAVSIREAYNQPLSVQSSPLKQVEELAGYGVKAEYQGQELQELYVGNEKLMTMHRILVPQVKERGTVIYLALNEEYLGYLLINDPLKKESLSAMETLKNWGIRRVMVTGDRKEAAAPLQDQLMLDDYKAQALPSDKVTYLENEMHLDGKRHLTAFVGDGINDAPVIARADVGFAMGGVGSDVAIEAADVVIMDDEPSKIIEAIRLGKRTVRIANENIIFALGVKILFLVLAALGLVGMEWAIFADVGVTVLAVFNAMRGLRK